MKLLLKALSMKKKEISRSRLVICAWEVCGVEDDESSGFSYILYFLTLSGVPLWSDVVLSSV